MTRLTGLLLQQSKNTISYSQERLHQKVTQLFANQQGRTAYQGQSQHILSLMLHSSGNPLASLGV